MRDKEEFRQKVQRMKSVYRQWWEGLFGRNSWVGDCFRANVSQIGDERPHGILTGGLTVATAVCLDILAARLLHHGLVIEPAGVCEVHPEADFANSFLFYVRASALPPRRRTAGHAMRNPLYRSPAHDFSLCIFTVESRYSCLLFNNLLL